MLRPFVILFVLLLAAGCSTSEVYKPTTAESDPSVSRDLRTALMMSEGISIEATLAREDNGRFRVDLVVDNHSDVNIDLSLGGTHLYLNGQDLKVHSTRFLRDWSYQSANRGTFAPNESAYASVSFTPPESGATGAEKLELWIDGVALSGGGRTIEFPKVAFGEPAKERRNYPPGAKP